MTNSVHTRQIILRKDDKSATQPSSLSQMRTYARCAELDHLPRILMTASSTPTAAADIAAPMRKLCPEYGTGSTQTDDNASLMWLTST